jgi:hypothetical protein
VLQAAVAPGGWLTSGVHCAMYSPCCAEFHHGMPWKVHEPPIGPTCATLVFQTGVIAAFAVAFVVTLNRRSVPQRAQVLDAAAAPSRLAYNRGEVMPQRTDCSQAAECSRVCAVISSAEVCCVVACQLLYAAQPMHSLR